MTANVVLGIMDVRVGEELNPIVDIRGLLSNDELATDTPTTVVIVERNARLTSDISNKAINTEDKTVDGVTLVAGEGVQYTIKGFLSDRYNIDITFSTNATPPAVRKGTVIYVVNDA